MSYPPRVDVTDEESNDAEDTAVREDEHVPPSFQTEAYHCPHCGVLTTQEWRVLLYQPDPDLPANLHHSGHWRVECRNCHKDSVWVKPWWDEGDPRMAHPQVRGGPRPHIDTPDDVRLDYEEARSIVGNSPRGACALLRLATQKLADELEPEKGDLNEKIGRLVSKGLPEMVQQALDALRVIGNEAVHPGELDLRDDVPTASSLFELVNVIVEDRITRPKRVQEVYAKLPTKKLRGIADRDKGST